MKSIVVKSKFGRSVPITCLSDRDLLFCLPIFILSLLGRYIVMPLYKALLMLFSLPGTAITGKLNRRVAKLVLVVNAVFIPVVYVGFNYLPLSGVEYEISAAIAQLVISCTLIQIFRIAQFSYGGKAPPFRAKPGGPSVNDFFIENANKIPDKMVDNKWTKLLLFTNMLVALYFFQILVFVWLFKDVSSWLYWSLNFSATLYIVFLINQPLEHMAAHSRRGTIFLRKDVSGLRDCIYYILELLRKYVVWPVGFWMPGCYRLMHRFIHHREVNGSADYLSTLRFDRTSFFSFIKASAWYSFFTRIFPLDSFRYFSVHHYSSKRDRLVLRVLIRRYAIGLLVFCLISAAFPIIGAFSILFILMNGLNNYVSILQQHGFHDRSTPYCWKNACNSPVHWGHHFNYYNAHVLLTSDHARTFWWHWEADPGKYPIFISSDIKDTYEANWLLFESRFWQKRYKAVSNLIFTASKNPSFLKNYLVGLKLIEQKPVLARLDAYLSSFLGKVVERIAGLFASRNALEILEKQTDNTFVHRRINNFYRFTIKKPGLKLPPELY